MRKLFLIFLALTLHLSAHAQAVACNSLNPFLYKIEKDGKSSFLLGTMHLGIPLTAYPSQVYTAFQNASVVAFENDRDEMKKQIGDKIQALSKQAPGHTLK